MNTTRLLLNSCLLLTLSSFGCTDSDSDRIPCGAGTERVDGRCQSTLGCGDGTVLQNNQCLPSSGSACGEGTRTLDGVCVPDTSTVCGAGTTPVDGICVNENVIVCGAGTDAVDGECLPSEDLECGVGTEEITDEDGDVTCEPSCDAPQVWDVSTAECVSECGFGTELDGDTGVCEFLCEVYEFYDADGDTCLTIPSCGRNSEAAGEGCEGWPWSELSLETICARRASYICDNLINCCDDAGEFYPGDPFASRLVGIIIDNDGFSTDTTREVSREGEIDVIRRVIPSWPIDHATCMAIESVRCEMTDIALYRHLVANGWATPDEAALEQFDDYFARDPDECTLPAGWENWKVDLQLSLLNGSTAIDSDCVNSAQCVDGAFCDVVDEDELGNLIWKCVARAAVGEYCSLGLTDTNFDTYDLRSTCADGLICANSSCIEPIGLGVGCSDLYQFGRRYVTEPAVCADGTVCRPTDPIAVADAPACKNFLSAGDNCRPTWSFQYGALDWCGPGLWCDDDAYVNAEVEAVSGPIGQCVVPIDDGGTCSYCEERDGIAFGYPSLLSDRCNDDSDCSLTENDESEVGYDQACASAESVCLHRYRFYPPVCPR